MKKNWLTKIHDQDTNFEIQRIEATSCQYNLRGKFVLSDSKKVWEKFHVKTILESNKCKLVKTTK